MKRVGGLDVHKDSVYLCILQENGEKVEEKFGTLMTIHGVQKHSAATILAEIGADMKMFATAAALVGWSGLRPRNEESAVKIKSRKTLHGNKFLRVMIVQLSKKIF